MKRAVLDLRDFVEAGSLLMASMTLILTLILAAAPGYGQIVNASLAGSVTDPTGAVIPDAQVTVKDVDTGLSTRDH